MFERYLFFSSEITPPTTTKKSPTIAAAATKAATTTVMPPTALVTSNSSLITSSSSASINPITTPNGITVATGTPLKISSLPESAKTSPNEQQQLGILKTTSATTTTKPSLKHKFKDEETFKEESGSRSAKQPRLSIPDMKKQALLEYDEDMTDAMGFGSGGGSSGGSGESNPLDAIQRMWKDAETTPPARHPVALSKHQCGVCFKHFSSSSALQIHMRTHTG